MKRTLLYILTLLFLLSSCERKIAYNGEVTQSKLVLQAEIGEGDTVVRAYVSRSRFFTELQNYYWGDSRLQSAIVEIQRDDQAWQQMDTCLVERNGYLPDRFFVLHLDSALRAGERVRIRVSHKDYETITAEQTVVHKPQCRVGDSPFKAEVWFINQISKLDMPWGTPQPILLEDPKYKIIVPVRSNGQYGLRIKDPRLFLETLIWAVAPPTT